MKKILLALALLFSFVAPMTLATSTAFAVDPVRQCSDPKLARTDVCNDLKNNAAGATNPFVRAIKDIIQVISFIVGVAAIVGIVVSGLRMILANGDSNAVANARSGLLYSLVGIVVVIFAQAIVTLVLNKL